MVFPSDDGASSNKNNTIPTHPPLKGRAINADNADLND